ncbi:MAG: hypothetical protein FWE58_02040 [Methanobrevibacter sp.]|nr:hypothetical protein [Methanobrevibacter sp.]
MANDGFRNEDEIVSVLNGKRYKEINSNMKKFLKTIFQIAPKSNDIIICNKIAGTEKTDIFIKINDETHYISIKKGSGNSVHQEPVEEFINYLKEKFNISKDIAEDIRFFIWGDNTLDGKGDLKNRLSANQLKKMFPEKIKNINNFFDLYKQELITRFLIEGSECAVDPDYIYYGTAEEGVGISMVDAVEWLIETNKNVKSITIGKLTFQAWNRNINGGTKSENKRGQIQVKWGSIGKDTTKIWENKYG